MSHGTGLTLGDVYRARARIDPLVRRTPLIPSRALSERLRAGVWLKLETLQETGSFKLRGAANKLLALAPDELAQGVVAVSTGNHARALAHAAGRLGVRATIFMSALVPRNKVLAVQALGADVRIAGGSQDEAQREAEAFARAEGALFVSPFDDPAVIAGQGTVGLELLEDLPELETVLVPVSGGGLIGGIALALKSAEPGLRVIGVTMERGAAMYESRRAGRPVEVVEEASLADSLGGGIGRDNRYTFALVQDLVDDLVLVSEDEIADAMRWCYWREQQVVEGGAAVGVAALLAGKVAAPPGPIAVVLSGRNVDMRAFTDLARSES